MKEPRVSIIVPFTSLNNYAFKCIEHCLSLNYSNFNLILLPDGRINLPPHLSNQPKVIVLPTGNVTIAEKRNQGISNFLDAQFYAFIDSDAYPHKDWLKNAIESFRKSEDAWIVGGPNICPPNENLKKRAVSNALKSILVSGGNAKAFRQKTKDSFCIDLPSCNLIVRKKTIEELGVFDKSYITGEDKEFCSKVVKKNMKIYFSRNVIVYHHPRSLFLPFIKQRIIYGLSVPKILRERFSFINLCLFLPMLFIFVIFSLFVISFFSQAAIYIFLIMILLHFLMVLFEALHWSAKFLEIPHTFLAIIIGNLTPGIGTLLALVKVKVNIQKVYKNYEYQYI
ncbi:MAG: glycosyltransferase [Candidatus Omnitrophica bacterium]|nr:glycosyltransferase [Candidatus Omnitrophota bacterium]